VDAASGTYNEDITLKSGICLEGAGVDHTLVSKSGASGISGDDVSYIIIQGLTVKGSGGNNTDGGGISLWGSHDIILQSCRLTGNVATNGGGISVSHSSVAINHCLIDGNTVSNTGAGIVKDADSSVSLTNVTVANNTWSNALGNGGVGGIRSYGSGLQIANSIIWGNNSENFSGDGSGITNSDIAGWSGGTNNVSIDPKFVSASDFQLQSGSPSAGMGMY
jgi:hypothetical protein